MATGRTSGASPGMRGAATAGLIVLVGLTLTNISNYLFQLAGARWLGPADFGALATLSAVILILGMPFAAMQLATARGVAGSLALGNPDEAGVITRAVVLVTTIIAACLAVVGIILSPWLAEVLQVGNWVPVALTAATLGVAIPSMVLLGAIQGQQRYVPYSLAPLSGAVGRLVLFVLALLAGMRLSGAMGMTLVGAAITLAVCWGFLRGRLALVGPVNLHDVRTSLVGVVPTVLGLTAITSLANVDVIVVKGALAPEVAGAFASAGLVAKVALVVPSAIIPVVQSRVAARAARVRGSRDILVRSELVTLGFGVLFTIFTWLFAEPIVHFLYGSDYAEAIPILPLYSACMTLLAVGTLQVNYHVTRHHHRSAYFALAVGIGQIVGLILFHATLWQVLYVNLAAALVLIALNVVGMRGVGGDASDPADATEPA